jgi:hypothetical protein
LELLPKSGLELLPRRDLELPPYRDLDHLRHYDYDRGMTRPAAGMIYNGLELHPCHALMRTPIPGGQHGRARFDNYGS